MMVLSISGAFQVLSLTGAHQSLTIAVHRSTCIPCTRRRFTKNKALVWIGCICHSSFYECGSRIPTGELKDAPKARMPLVADVMNLGCVRRWDLNGMSPGAITLQKTSWNATPASSSHHQDYILYCIFCRGTPYRLLTFTSHCHWEGAHPKTIESLLCGTIWIRNLNLTNNQRTSYQHTHPQ